MIAAIEHLKPRQAAGLLARAAMSLAYREPEPPAHDALADEAELRERLIGEVRHRLGVAPDDESSESLERIAAFLDEESDKLLPPPDTEAALNRMAERGDLPSDLYEIVIIPQIIELYGRGYDLEKDIIETTIRAPDTEQHFGPARRAKEPAMISLFLRHFQTRWPLRNFYMLVAAQREGMVLHVHQAWRIYPQKVDISETNDLVDVLRRFADGYGIDVEVGDDRGHFFLFAEGKIPDSFTVRHGKTTHKFYVSRFAQRDPDTNLEQSALIVSINQSKYEDYLKGFAVKREDILEQFVPAISRFGGSHSFGAADNPSVATR